MRTLALIAAILPVTPIIAAPVPKGLKATTDEVAILGTWQAVMWDYGDPKVEQPWAEELRQQTLTFTNDGKMVVSYPSGFKHEVRYTLDPNAELKSFDLTGGKTDQLGVYELDGDSLILCFDPDGNNRRPPSLKANPKKGFVLFTFKRVKDK